MAIYLIKINVALMLLYGFYRLTVSRDTSSVFAALPSGSSMPLPDGSGTQSGILGARYTNDGEYGECIC